MSTVATHAPAPSPTITLLHPQFLRHSAHFHYRCDAPRVREAQRFSVGRDNCLLCVLCLARRITRSGSSLSIPYPCREELLSDYDMLVANHIVCG